MNKYQRLEMIIAYLIENAKNKRANFISCMIFDIASHK